MNRLERWESPQVPLLAALEGLQQTIWTALPGIIVSYNHTVKTCSVQTTIKGRIRKVDGTYETRPLPVLLDCPVIFPSGGGYTLTFPIAEGDECLVVFSSRCIDKWWYSGGIQEQAIVRMHDLSDGFVLVGCSSRPNVPPNLNPNAVQLRNNSGSAYIELQGTEVNIVSTSLKHNGVNIGATHTHGGVASGGSTTGVPT